VDTANGAILGLKKAAKRELRCLLRRNLQRHLLQKTNATDTQNGETGTASLGSATLVVTSGGQVTVSNAQGGTMAQGTVTPVADVTSLYGSPGELDDPCNGVFTFK